jgi:phosphoenolpyruvate-protein kinase (PTS system EI component)
MYTGGMEGIAMKHHVGRLWGAVGIGLLNILVVVPVGASDRPVTGDKVIQETQEAVTATKDYTIQQKDAFQRKVQTELDEIQVRITQLRRRVKHASAEAKADIQKAIVELEKKKELANKKAQDIHSATASSWEQVKEKTVEAMDDLRDSLNRALSRLP